MHTDEGRSYLEERSCYAKDSANQLDCVFILWIFKKAIDVKSTSANFSVVTGAAPRNKRKISNL